MHSGASFLLSSKGELLCELPHVEFLESTYACALFSVFVCALGCSHDRIAEHVAPMAGASLHVSPSYLRGPGSSLGGTIAEKIPDFTDKLTPS